MKQKGRRIMSDCLTESQPNGPPETSPTPVSFEDGKLNAGVLSFDAPESVCALDDRTQITPTTTRPYYWICQLNINFGGTMYIGSGWLCTTGSTKYNVVATCGHQVYRNGAFADSVQVTPARNSSIAPYGSFTVPSSGLRASDKWQAGGSDKANYNYGAILIPKPYANVLGSMGMSVMSDADLMARIVTNCGYPGDKPIGTLWWTGGPISQVQTNVIRYMNDTAGGQSGSPVYTWSNSYKLVSVGIHGFGGCPNGAVRITNDVYNDLVAWGDS